MATSTFQNYVGGTVLIVFLIFFTFLFLSGLTFMLMCYARYSILITYRVTITLVQNLPLTSNQKFRFGLTCPALAMPKRNLCFEINRCF